MRSTGGAFRTGAQRAQQRPLEQVLLGEDGVALRAAVLPGAGARLDGQQLFRVVPLVERVLGGESLVTLEADEFGLERGRQHLRYLSLPGARRPLDQQRFLQAHREAHRGDDLVAGDVVGRLEGRSEV